MSLEKGLGSRELTKTTCQIKIPFRLGAPYVRLFAASPITTTLAAQMESIAIFQFLQWC